MRVGFVGAGGITRTYRTSLRQLGAEVVAVHDTDPARARALAEEEGAAVFDDYRVMLDQARLEAVFICVPPFAHERQVVDAAERGIPLFVAKPVALDLDTARRGIEALKRAKVVNQSGYMWRSSDAVLMARELAADRPLVFGAAQVLVNTPPTPWWRVRAKSGGQVIEQSTHLVDLLRLFLGEVVEVQAMGHTGSLTDLADFEDSTVGSFRFASGAVASLTSTHTGGIGRYSLVLGGRDLLLDLNAAGNALVAKLDGEAIDYRGEENGYHRQIAAFVDAVEANDPARVPTTYRDAARTLAATVAFNEALATGRTVPVPEV